MDTEKLNNPESQEELSRILKEGAIAKFDHCGAFYNLRFNPETNGFEVAEYVMNGRFSSSGTLREWRSTDNLPEEFQVKEVWREKAAPVTSQEAGPSNPFSRWYRPKGKTLAGQIIAVVLADGVTYDPTQLEEVSVSKLEA